MVRNFYFFYPPLNICLMAMLRSGSWVALLPFQRCAADNCELQFADVIVVSCYLSLVFCWFLFFKKKKTDQVINKPKGPSKRVVVHLTTLLDRLKELLRVHDPQWESMLNVLDLALPLPVAADMDLHSSSRQRDC